MREIRTSGSEGGAGANPSSLPPICPAGASRLERAEPPRAATDSSPRLWPGVTVPAVTHKPEPQSRPEAFVAGGERGLDSLESFGELHHGREVGDLHSAHQHGGLRIRLSRLDS